MLENDIKKLIKAMNYSPKNGVSNIYFKEYKIGNELYEIFLDFNDKRIDYGNKIKLGNTTTCNFAKPENFVVLECVNRLLEKGYKPQNIELEKIYPSGHGHSGNLDILIYDENRKAYLMIECKTWGIEYKKEINKMYKDGGQLFTYYALDRDAKYLCLYTSVLENGKIDYKNSIISIDNEWISLSTSKEIYTHWNKSFKDNGIFEKHAEPYDIKHKALTYEMLDDLKEEDSGKIFNQIMEILRHNVVSDKPNAFNKLLNLFVCKIIDEDRNDTEELHFQWLDDDTDESLQMRLNDLYKKGMWRFLNINVTDYSETEINNALQSIDADESFKQTIKDMFIDTRLKKSPNFAFKEVLDEKSFKANAKIVKEIVLLLQSYKFRYRQKHQFLGDFFELLLNTSMKQEAGQYFTPVPITRFIISSLPIKEMIIDKIKNNEGEILPVVIDYAAGSGHFLTEYMEQVQNILEKFGMSMTKEEIDKAVEAIDISFASPTIKNKIKTWIESEKFVWAKDYVYGIDLDDRLVKTAKVSAFFNGDGEANIIWANGLDNFKKSNEYIGKLKETQTFDKKNNGQFDILISNPPYSVEAFKSTLKNGKETFELYDNLTDNSSEIECLFVERMKQLLKVGGKAGVILPISILTNSGIHSKAREIIFKYFKVKSIVELGSGTFMKTGTNTVILFLERRPDNDYKEIERAVNKFFDDNLDVTVLGIENAFSKYVMNVYDNLSFKDYLKLINGEVIEHELYNDYSKEFGGNLSNIRQLEKEKILYFILTCQQESVIIKTGKKQEEKIFLGYEFSERRGHEGLKWLSTGTKLYNENDQLDTTKANTYIYNIFNDNKLNIDDSLEKNVQYKFLSDLIDYGTSKFDKKLNLNKKGKLNLNLNNNFPVKKLGELVNLIKGVNYNKEQQTFINTNNIILTADNVTLDCNLNITKKIYLDENLKLENTKKLQKGDIFMCFSSGSKRHVGKCAFIEDDLNYYAGGFMCILRSKTELINMKYLYLFLSSKKVQSLVSNYCTGANINNLSNEINNIDVLLPPIEIQESIVKEIEKNEHSCNLLLQRNKELELQTDNIIGHYFNENIMQKIGDYSILIKRGKSAKYGESDIQIIKSGQARGYETFDFSNKYYVSNNFVSDERNLVKGDLLINSTGVGTAGRVTLFNLEGNYVVDSHITIVRLNQNKLLPKFALYALVHIGFKTIEQMATGQSGQIELAIDTIKNIKIPLPSIEEQRMMVSKIEELEKEINKNQNELHSLMLSNDNYLEKLLFR